MFFYPARCVYRTISSHEFRSASRPLSHRTRTLQLALVVCLVAFVALLPFAQSARAQSVVASINVSASTYETDGIAVNPETNMIYVASQTGTNTGAGPTFVINGATNALVATITDTSGNAVQPWAIAINPVTNMVYVANTGGGSNNGNITVINGATNSYVTTISNGNSLHPYAMIINPLTNTLYVANSGSSNITVFNLGTLGSSTISLSGTAAALAIDPGANLLYALTAAGVVEINMSTLSATTVTLAGGSAIGVDTSLHEAYVAVSGGVDAITGTTIISTLSDPNHPSNSESLAVNSLTHRVYVSSEGGSGATCSSGCVSVYVCNFPYLDYLGTVAAPDGANTVAVDTETDIAYAPGDLSGVTIINGSTASAIATLTVPGGDEVVAVNPVSHKAYIASDYNGSNNTITVIDGATNSAPEASPITTGTNPWAIAVNPATNQVYVANYGAGTVTEISDNGTTFVTQSVTVDGEPDALAIDPYQNIVYVDNCSGEDLSVITSGSLAGSNIQFSPGICADSIAVNPVLNMVYGASSTANESFAFGGGPDPGSPIYDGGFAFGGTTPIAVAANAAAGVDYTLMQGISSQYGSAFLIAEDRAGRYGTYGDICLSPAQSTPIAMDVNPTTNTVFVACANGYIDAVQGQGGFSFGTTTPIPASSSNTAYSAVAVNPVTNFAYVADNANSILNVINGATNTIVAQVNLAFAPVSLAVNVASNKIYVLCQGSASNAPSVSIVDGATNTVLGNIQLSNTNSPLVVNNTINEIAANPVTGDIFTLLEGPSQAIVTIENTPSSTCSNHCLTVSASLDPSNSFNSGNATYTVDPAFVFTATNSFNSASVAGVYYQIDSQQGTWIPATASSSPGQFSATASNVIPGFHMLYAFATDGDDNDTSAFQGLQASPLVGAISSYGFLVAPPIANEGPSPDNFGSVSVGASSPQYINLANDGGSTLSYSYQITGTYANDFVVNPNVGGSCASGAGSSGSGTLAPDTGCTLLIDFSPSIYSGQETATLTFTDNSLNTGTNAVQTNALSGTGITPVPTFTGNPANPSYITSGSIAYTDSEPGVSFMCSLVVQNQPTSYSSCESGYSYSGLMENTYYTFSVTAYDGTNTSSPLTWTWEVVPSQVTVNFAGTGTGSVVSTSPSGLSCSSTCAVAFDGVPVTLMATPSGNSTFAGWSNVTNDPNDQCPVAGNPTLCVLQTGDSFQSVTATFNSSASSYSVTVNEMGTGTGNVSDGGNLSCSEASGMESGNCSNTYSGNPPTVTLTATATSPSTFIGWGGGACMPSNSTVGPTGGTCSLTLGGNITVMPNFLPAPITITVTFPVSTIPVTEAGVYNCPGNANPSPSAPCTMAEGPSATSVSLTAQAVSTSFQVNITATEVPPSSASDPPNFDGICESNDDTPTGVAADFDCRFLQFFNYGTDPTTGGAIVPFCVPYSNGNCVHYEVTGTNGSEPDSSMYLGPINWVLTWNHESVTPPGPYWTGSTPQLYDDPDYAVFPTSPFGTNCAVAMTVNSGPTVTYACQFEYDITTFYNAIEPVDSGIGGTTRQFNDVVVAWPPTSVPNNTTLPLLNGNSTTTPASGSAAFGNPVGFNITLTNNGTTTASGITLNDPMPPGATWTLSSSSVNGCGISGSVNAQILSCPAFSLAPAATATFSVSSSNAGAGVYANTATFTIGTQQTLAVATVTVQGLTPSFSGLSSNTISYGTASVLLSGTVGVGGVYPAAGDTVQITINGTTQSATIAGTSGGFSYAFPTATIPASSTPYTVTYKFLGDSSFSSVTNSSTTLTVNKANQTINFTTNAPTSASYGSNFTVVASATSGLGLTYGNSGSCSNSGAMYTITSGSGTCDVIVSQSGTSNYNAAQTVTQMTSATKATSTTTITSNTPNPSTVGQSVTVGVKVTGAGTPTGSVTVTAKLSSTTVTCSATLSSGAGSCGVTLSTAGGWTLTASYGGDGNFNTSSTASGTTQTVNAAASALKFTPAALNFGTVYVGNSELLDMTITNTGSSMVTFTSFSIASISGDDSTGFLGVSFCPKTLNAGKSCTIIMSFTADSNVTKTHAANLVIADNASGSPQSILMSATIINPKATLSATSLNFGTQKTGTTSTSKLVTLTNSGTTNLSLTGLTITGNFGLASGTTCTKSSTLTPGQPCSIYINFAPQSPKGSKSGKVTITDNAQNSPQSITLSGTGN